jgi:hypothetical protein
MQHERVCVGAKLGDDERHLVSHRSRNEMHVTRQPIELGDDDRAPPLAGLGERGRELRPTLQGIHALAGFDGFFLAIQ